MTALADTLALVNWAGWVFPALIAIACTYVLRWDRDPKLAFRLVQFISLDGKANSWALARVTGLLTTTWVVWYETLNGRLSEWLILAYLGTVFAASAWTAGTAAKERTAALNAERPIAEPQPGTKVNTEFTAP